METGEYEMERVMNYQRIEDAKIMSATVKVLLPHPNVTWHDTTVKRAVLLALELEGYDSYDNNTKAIATRVVAFLLS